MIKDNDRKELTDKFSTMPPHPEVPAALRKLRNAGFRLFCLTDNLLEVQTRQLTQGGIVDLFERRFSADGVKHLKPSRQAYALTTLDDRLPHLGQLRSSWSPHASITHDRRKRPTAGRLR